MRTGILSRAFGEPFITATGIAAFVHSTWALAMLFSGAIPDVRTQPLAFALAIGPAALLAFSIDVGQIMTSADIRSGQRTRGKIAAFATLAIATYYLQWLYMIAHVPALAIGAGVRSDWQPLVAFVRDASIWIVPALLPLATLLYTVSNGTHAQERKRNASALYVQAHPERMRKAPEVRPVPAIEAPATRTLGASAQRSGASGNATTGALAHAVRMTSEGEYVGACPTCGWETPARPTERNAKASLAAHGKAHNK